MKHYYVRYGEFRNIYALTYAETAKDAAELESRNFERITRKEALRLAARERDLRAYNPMFSGIADVAVMPPAWYIAGMSETQLSDEYDCKNHIWEAKYWEVVEPCPYCEAENVYPRWKGGYIATCRECGKQIFLCDECLHSDDNAAQKCDWHEEDGISVCFRGRINNANSH